VLASSIIDWTKNDKNRCHAMHKELLVLMKDNNQRKLILIKIAKAL
jgi:hypothetical protein